MRFPLYVERKKSEETVVIGIGMAIVPICSEIQPADEDEHPVVPTNFLLQKRPQVPFPRKGIFRLCEPPDRCTLIIR